MIKFIFVTLLSFFILTYTNIPLNDSDFVIHPITVTATKYVSKEDKEIECLAKNIYFEARSESELGQKAVASVVFNRIKHKNYPNTVCKNVYQVAKKSCAWSWVCDEHPDTIRDQKTFAKIKRLAQSMYGKFQNGKGYDYVGGALYFHHENVIPYWLDNVTFVTQIDDHLFYRNGS